MLFAVVAQRLLLSDAGRSAAAPSSAHHESLLIENVVQRRGLPFEAFAAKANRHLRCVLKRPPSSALMSRGILLAVECGGQILDGNSERISVCPFIDFRELAKLEVIMGDATVDCLTQHVRDGCSYRPVS